MLSFFGRFARDVGGNTLALMAAALIPMAGLVGGGVDISRMYIIKTRMQHACDAGSLAGRKNMGGGVWGTDDNTVALQFYDANFQPNGYGSTGTTRAFSESGGTVTGTASATVPMTLMRVLGKTTDTITVTCTAEMRLPNTDVMFVLDVTGSMNCTAASTTCTNNGGVPASGSKIDGLKTAVKCFYEIVARLKTNATCATTNATGGTGNQVQIRFGFMPYASNVNVGYSLPPAFFANSWKYQSRSPNFTTTTTYTYPAYSDSSPAASTSAGSWSSYTNSSTSSATANTTCVAPATTTSTSTSSSDSSVTTSGNTKTYTTTTVTTTTSTRYTSTLQYTTSFFGLIKTYYCQVQSSTKTDTSSSTVTHTSTGVPTVTKTFASWHYGQITTDISGLKNGTSWNSSLQVPIGTSGTNTTVAWDGCVEERPTVQTTNFTPIPSGAYDLNIDLVPAAGNANTLWGPELPAVIYARNVTSTWASATTTESDSTNNYYNSFADYCPTAAQKLQSWPDPTAFDAYVDSLVAQGNTYHDIGMLWGARFMSPTGIFASENALTQATAYGTGGADIERHMIFMTDGDSTSNACDYNAYGVPFYDKRETTDVGLAATCNSNYQPLIDQINLRYAALCTAVKNMNITLWVISFGNGSSSDTETRLSNCATPGRYFKATDSATLQSQFASIANQISQLRLTN